MSKISANALQVKCLLCCKIIGCQGSNTKILLDHIRKDHCEIILRMTKCRSHSRHSLSSKQSKLNKEFIDDDINYPTKPSKTNEHPEVDISDYSTDPKYSSIKRLSSKPSVITSNPLPMESERHSEITKKGKPENPQGNVKVLYRRCYKYKKLSTAGLGKKRELYRTSIQKWRPGNSTIVCPHCGCNKRPLIMAYVNKVSHCKIGSDCLLSCCWCCRPLCYLLEFFTKPRKKYLHCPVCYYFLGIYDHEVQVVQPNKVDTERQEKTLLSKE